MKRKQYIGIDLGTKYSSISFFNHEKGIPQIGRDIYDICSFPSQIHVEKINDTYIFEIPNNSWDQIEPLLFYDSKKFIGIKFQKCDEENYTFEMKYDENKTSSSFQSLYLYSLYYFCIFVRPSNR